MKQFIQEMMSEIQHVKNQKEYVEVMIHRLCNEANLQVVECSINKFGEEGMLVAKHDERFFFFNVYASENNKYTPANYCFILNRIKEKEEEIVLQESILYHKFSTTLKEMIPKPLFALEQKKEQNYVARQRLIQMFQRDLSKKIGYHIKEKVGKISIIVPDYVYIFEENQDYFKLLCGKERTPYKFYINGSLGFTTPEQEWEALKTFIEYSDNEFKEVPSEVKGFDEFYSFIKKEAEVHELDIFDFINGYLGGGTIFKVKNILFTFYDIKKNVLIEMTCEVVFKQGFVFIYYDGMGKKSFLNGTFVNVMEELKESVRIMKEE